MNDSRADHVNLISFHANVTTCLLALTAYYFYSVLSCMQMITYKHVCIFNEASDLGFSEDANDLSVIMMASSICALLFDYTSEEALLNHPNFNSNSLSSLYRLIARSLASCRQVKLLMFNSVMCAFL